MNYETELCDRCNAFIEDTSITVRGFCPKIGLSHEYFYKWQRGEVNLSETKLHEIEAYLNSKEAQSLLEKTRTYVPLEKASNQFGLNPNKIRDLCKMGALRHERTSGGRYFVNIDDLKKFVQLKFPERLCYESIPHNQMLVFGALYTDLDTNWKPILSAHNWNEIFDSERHEYNCQYWISNDGYIFNAFTRNLMGTKSDRKGYICVNLEKGKDNELVTRYVHRLVAEFFCPNRRYKDYVHHINGRKQDNRASNLLWVTKAEHDECHRFMKKDEKAYRRYVNKIKRENKW